MITEDYVSFETAKLLKEKGFEILTDKVYDNQNKLDYQNVVCWQEERLPYISAPTQQMAMKWLREVHNMFIKINIISYTTIAMEQCPYFFTTYRERKPVYGYMIDYYSTYEEAVEAAIKYCLENLI